MALGTCTGWQFGGCDLFGTRLLPSSFLPMQSRSTLIKPLIVQARKRANTRTDSAKIRNRRMRQKFDGTARKPRLSVFCSEKQLYVTLVDDKNKKCLFYASTLQRSIRSSPNCSTTVEELEGIGIKIYNSLQIDPSSPKYPSSSLPSNPPPEIGALVSVSRKRRAVATGVQKTRSNTSMLVNFLPTGTLLTFEIVLPSVYAKGECSAITSFMIYILLGICTLSCFFFHFTDSLRLPDGKVIYGFVTPKGLALFTSGPGAEVPKDDRYKLNFTDFVHAMMSVMVFVAIALSDHRVTNCLLPRHANDLDEVMQCFPLMVGLVCSGRFLVFPNTHYGIGCLSA